MAYDSHSTIFALLPNDIAGTFRTAVVNYINTVNVRANTIEDGDNRSARIVGRNDNGYAQWRDGRCLEHWSACGGVHCTSRREGFQRAMTSQLSQARQT